MIDNEKLVRAFVLSSTCKTSALLNNIDRIPEVGDVVKSVAFAVDAVWVKFESGKEISSHVYSDSDKSLEKAIKELNKTRKRKILIKD